jgi:hypothetical protein
MEMLLKQVTGSPLMSMLDGYLGYNQILVAEENRPKTTFRTPWVTYDYVRMPFGLKNLGETFQREMDHSFKYLIINFMENYQYDLTVYSKIREIHIKHLI